MTDQETPTNVEEITVDAQVTVQTTDQDGVSVDASIDAQGTSNEAATSSEGEQESAPALSESQKVALLEALLLASGEPLSLARIQEILVASRSEVVAIADILRERLSDESRGIELVVVAEKLQLRTKAAYAEQVRQLMAVKPRKLSQAALETLAVVAYQQPIVKSEIDKIRGVDVSPTIKTLLERKLIKILGYQASVGQPALYGTTEDFLQVFGLPALSALPSLQDVRALAKEPGEALRELDGESGDDNEESSEGLSEDGVADESVSVDPVSGGETASPAAV